MDRVKVKYRKMLVTSKESKKRVVKWIEKYRRNNKEQEISRGKKNACETILQKR
jgi:hypothetical protein